MAIRIDITSDQEKALRAAWGGHLDAEAFHALVIEGYRSRRYGAATVRALLGHASRWETQKWLGDRNVESDYTQEDLEADRSALNRLFRKSA